MSAKNCTQEYKRNSCLQECCFEIIGSPPSYCYKAYITDQNQIPKTIGKSLLSATAKTIYPIWHEKLKVCALTNAATPCPVEPCVKQHPASGCRQLLPNFQMTKFAHSATVFEGVSPGRDNIQDQNHTTTFRSKNVIKYQRKYFTNNKKTQSRAF